MPRLLQDSLCRLLQMRQLPASRAEAFAVQDRFAEILNEPCVGWKVGAAVHAVQIMEGHDGPIVGRLFSHRQYISLDAKIYSEQGISESI